MSVTIPIPAKRSRWMDWKPKVRILANSPEHAPTKPSELSFVGFVGATPEQISEIDDPPGIPWAEWKAAALNALFQEQGVTGQPGRITAATIQHGERSH